jgi:hypothetical protein
VSFAGVVPVATTGSTSRARRKTSPDAGKGDRGG